MPTPDEAALPSPGRPAGLPARLACVDALRGAAAPVVVIHPCHHVYLATHLSRPDIPDQGTFPYAVLLEAAYRHGGVAVELFWVLSGFVFTHVYLARRTSARDFAVARFARLYPLHLATLLLVAGVQAVNWQAFGHWQIYGSNDLRHLGLQLVMASNWTTLSRGPSDNGPIWSVSLELVAYGAFFLTLGLLRHVRLAAAAALCALAAALSQAAWFDPPLLRPAALGCVAHFFLGSCAWFAVAACGRRAAAVLAVAAGLAAAALAAALAGLPAAAVAAGAAALLVLAAALDLRGVRGGAASGGLGALGDMSYSLYLVHVPLQMIALTAVDLLGTRGDRGFADAAWTLPLYVAASCLAARAVHRRLEVPAGRALRRALARPAPQSPRRCSLPPIRR